MSEDKFEPGKFRSLWQSMPTEPVGITVNDMRMRAAVFEGRIRRRNRIEYVACIIVAAIFSWYATFESRTILWPIANIMLVLATIYVAYSLHRKGTAGATPDGGTVASLIEFHRHELVRQRNALSTVWRWYLLPFTPGLILWFIAMWVGRGAEARNPTAFAIALALTFVLCASVFAMIWLANLLGAARLQRMIDELDRYRETT